MSYITIRDYGEDRFIEKKSEFIGYAKRVESEEEAKAFVNEIKSMHKQARHNCWAYVIGENMGIQRYSDAGRVELCVRIFGIKNGFCIYVHKDCSLCFDAGTFGPPVNGIGVGSL